MRRLRFLWLVSILGLTLSFQNEAALQAAPRIAQGGNVDDSEGECERLLTVGSQYCAAQYDIRIQRCDDPACFVQALNRLHLCSVRLLRLYHDCMNGPFGLEDPRNESGSSGFW